MNLENVIKKELDRRDRLVDYDMKSFEKFTKDYITVEELSDGNKTTHLDIDKIRVDGKEDEYNFIVSCWNHSRIKRQILTDLIRENSGLDYNSVNMNTVSEMIERDKYYGSRYSVFSDVVSINDQREFAMYFGKEIDVSNLKDLSSEEQVRTFTNYLLQTIYEMGYTNEDLYQACNNIGINFGGVEKEHSRSL